MIIELIQHIKSRGFWVILLWSAWIAMVMVWGTAFGILIVSYTDLPQYYGVLPALPIAIWWYKMQFTVKHPLLSTIIFYIGGGLFVEYVTEYFSGIDIINGI